MSTIDHDLSTEQVLALLSVPDHDDGPVGPRGWTRRRFLQAIGAGAFAGATIGTIADDFFGGDIPEAWAGTPIAPNDGILVVVTMYGGNDGLNTVVPYTNPTYYAKRPNVAIAANRVLPIDATHGFHPELAYLKSLWDAGKVAVIHGVGYPNPDLSHFTSMAIWMGGRFGGGPNTSGWIGRWLDGQPAATADLAAVSVDTSVPLHMVGASRRAFGLSPSGTMFGTELTNADQARVYAGVRQLASASGGRGQWHDMFASTMKRQLDLAADVRPVFATGRFPSGTIARKLTIAARLINVDIGLRVIDVSYGGFDTHGNQPNTQAALLRDLNSGLQSFFSTLAPERLSQVTIAVVSEFGRTIGSNDSLGTDHGTAAPLFVIGAQVKGGTRGAQPSLDTVDKNRRMIHSVDFRSMYGSLLDGWLGGGGGSIVNGSFENLDLFAAGPGGAVAGSAMPIVYVTPPSDRSGYVPLTPTRVVDTRDGTGDRLGPIGPGETWTFTFKDKFGIPADAVAVAMNLTSVNATEPTFVTVFPAGDTRPFTANLNPVPGLAVPNLVVGRTSAAGAVSFYNNSGSVDLVADLVGYFKTSGNVKLTPLTPTRLLDTRDGTGRPAAGPLGPGEAFDLLVVDRGDVPKTATAVALNITVTEPTASSYLTVWPTGKDRPLAASLNMVPNQTVPNLVLAQVGKDGQVGIFNYAGSTHVVADVLGYFSTSSTSRYVAIAPARVLDTRESIGITGEVGQTPAVLKLAGVAGIPSSATAVLLNTTIVQPTEATYVTVYPAGGDRPLAANLNAVAGQIVPNMVIGRLGTDGSVAIFNFAGTTHLVADVMGYFTT